jgi:ribonuclease HI
VSTPRADNRSSHTLFVDGGASPNPGMGGAGGILLRSLRNGMNDAAEVDEHAGELVDKLCHYLGDRVTNNEAEFSALILGLDMARQNGVRTLDVFMDSQLVIKAMEGECKVNNKNLKRFHELALKTLSSGKFESVQFTHVPRSLNTTADKLASSAIRNELWGNLKQSDDTLFNEDYALQYLKSEFNNLRPSQRIVFIDYVNKNPNAPEVQHSPTSTLETVKKLLHPS